MHQARQTSRVTMLLAQHGSCAGPDRVRARDDTAVASPHRSVRADLTPLERRLRGVLFPAFVPIARLEATTW